ncbi:MAG: DMT family transporter [Thermostichus sp. DG02_5_bins_236]
MLASTLLLALQNVILKLIFHPHPVWTALGGWVQPSPLHSVVLLHVRTGLMMVLLMALAPRLYPALGSTLQSVLARIPSQAKPFNRLSAGLSSLCLCLALILLYMAIGQLPTGVAVTLFSIYPAITSALAWWMWRDPFTLWRGLILLLILAGVALTGFVPTGVWAPNWLGILSALGAGSLYAGYLLFAQASLSPDAGRHTPLPPLVFSMLTFIGTWLLTGSIVLLRLVDITFQNGWAIGWVSLLSAMTALAAYLLNNSGIQHIGAAKAAIISASGPIFTALLGWVLLRETLALHQLVGATLVTLGLVGISLTPRPRQP